MPIQVTTEYTWSLYAKYLRFCLARNPRSKLISGLMIAVLLLSAVLVIAIGFLLKNYTLIRLYLVLLAAVAVSILAAPVVRYLLLISERGRVETLRFTPAALEVTYGIPTKPIHSLYIWEQIVEIYETDDFFCLTVKGEGERIVDRAMVSPSDLARLTKLLADKASKVMQK